MPFEDRSHDPVLQRLRKMREKSVAREESALASLMDKVRATGRSGRVDWVKGQMRWFVGGKHAAKIKANIEVEKTLGREQPELWSPSPAGGHDSNNGYNVNLMAEEKRISMKISQEYSKLAITGNHPMLDPLMIAEREWAATNTAAGNSGDGSADANFQVPEKQLPAPKADFKRLRLLEIHRSERAIEELASEVVSDIKLICMDDYRESKAEEPHEYEEYESQPDSEFASFDGVDTSDKEPAFHTLASGATASNQKDSTEVAFPPVADSVAIWG
jgi:hypothetical protein